MPGRIEHHLHIHLFHFGKARQLALNVGSQHVAHAAAWSGHRHSDINFFPPIYACGNFAGIDQAQIDNVYGNFGIVHGLELIPDHGLAEDAVRSLSLFLSIGVRRKPQRVCVFCINSTHVADLAVHRVATAQDL